MKFFAETYKHLVLIIDNTIQYNNTDTNIQKVLRQVLHSIVSVCKYMLYCIQYGPIDLCSIDAYT